MEEKCCVCHPPRWPRKNEKDYMYLITVYVRHQREKLLAVATDALNRHRNQIEFGLPTTLTEDEIRDVAAYAQALRDITSQDNYPYNVVWPETPAGLRKDVIG